MRHTIDIDGEKRDTDILAMAGSFILCRKMCVAPLTSDNMASVRRIAETPAWEDVYDRHYLMALDLDQ